MHSQGFWASKWCIFGHVLSTDSWEELIAENGQRPRWRMYQQEFRSLALLAKHHRLPVVVYRSIMRLAGCQLCGLYPWLR